MYGEISIDRCPKNSNNKDFINLRYESEKTTIPTTLTFYIDKRLRRRLYKRKTCPGTKISQNYHC